MYKIIIFSMFCVFFSESSVAKNDKLGNFLKSNCVVVSNNTGQEIPSCDPQQVLKELPSAPSVVLLEVYEENNTIIVFQILLGPGAGTIEKHEYKYVRKGDLFERHHKKGGCVIIEKIIGYGNGSLASKTMGYKGVCTGALKRILDEDIGKISKFQTISIE